MANPELTVTVLDERTVLAQRDGGEARGSLRLSARDRSVIDLFADWLRHGKIDRRKDLEVFGSLLYETIFHGEVGNFFEQSLGSLSSSERLRVQLSFAGGVAELARLPWEYLHRPDTETRPGLFLATAVNLVLSRYLPLQAARPRALQPEDSPLRVLIVVSKPTDLGPVLDAVVVETIQNLQSRFPVKVHLLEKPTLDRLLEKLGEHAPHVLHFIGHARFDPAKDQGAIALLGPDETSAAWYPDQVFAESFAQARAMPRVFFLQACEGAAIDLSANFAGLAPKLIRAGAQALVGMQYPVTNEVAIVFSRAFYGELLRGQPLDHAAQAARWRLVASGTGGYDNPAFGAPVLYMRARDGMIQPTGGAAAAQG